MISISKKIFSLLILSLLLVSCVSRKKIVYFQDVGKDKSKEIKSDFSTKLKKDDVLMIVVSSPDVEASLPFNLPVFSISGFTNSAASAYQYQLYLIDNEGNIDFPTLGKLNVAGKTKIELISQLTDRLKKYINDPIVNIRIMNYKIAVTGEVNKPGNFNIVSERVSLLDAISLAGDLTIYGRRDNVIVIREVNGVKTINRIDLTKSDFISSDFYYLSQNDVVYVEPNKTRINSSMIGPNTAVIISTVSVLITVFTLLKK